MARKQVRRALDSCGRGLLSVCRAMATLGLAYYPILDLRFHGRVDGAEAARSGPAPGHPERPAGHVPQSEVERQLWSQFAEERR